MRTSIALLIPAFFLAAALAQPAMAQEKKADKKAMIRGQKVVHEDERVRVVESVWKPGEANPMQERGYRITRVLRGSSSMLRTFADGKEHKMEWKAGETHQFGPDKAHSTKNVGKSEVVTYTVTLKQPK